MVLKEHAKSKPGKEIFLSSFYKEETEAIVIPLHSSKEQCCFVPHI